MDALIVTPGGRENIYQDLGIELTAIEPPLWARLIAGYLIDRDHQINIIDTEALCITPQMTAEIINDVKPALVIIVVYGHQPSASTQTMMAARILCQQIKVVNPSQKIILVGGHVAALPERTIAEEPVEFVCAGEGPETCHQLIRALALGETFSTIPGLVWQDEFKQIKRNPNPPLINDLDQNLHGNVWHLLPMEKYRAHNWQCFGDLAKRQPYASIYTSLGCPFKCFFCCINAPFVDNKYRCRSPENVVAEIDMLYHTYGVKTFKIIDEMFVLKKNHYIPICELLAEKPYAHELNIWAYARIDTVKVDTLTLMRKAGIKWLALGIESADESVRDGSNKSLDSNDIINIVSEIRAADISVIGNFIFGLPHDSVSTMRDTLSLAHSLNCEFANFYSAMAYPGSKLYVEALKNGTELPEKWSGFSQHSYDCLPLKTEFETAKTVLQFRDDAFHDFFSSPGYLTFIEKKFGLETRLHIEKMSSKRLKRLLLDKV